MINSSNSDSASTTLTADSVITNGGIRIYELSKGASGADSINPYRIRMNVTLKESGTYSDFANINTGGLKADGTDGVNPVSYLILPAD